MIEGQILSEAERFARRLYIEHRRFRLPAFGTRLSLNFWPIS